VRLERNIHAAIRAHLKCLMMRYISICGRID
jgi:hypothetical protein